METAMPDGLYDTDILAWSREQADRLRRVAAGERVNNVDWVNIIEEVESLGRSETKAVRTLLIRALEHGLKIVAWPGHRAVEHWTDEVANVLLQARDGLEASMVQHLDLPAMFDRARREVLRTARTFDVPPRSLPTACPVTMEELRDEDFIAHDLIARLRAAPPA